MNILLATDHSPHARAATELTRRLAAPDHTITVFSVGHVHTFISPGATAWMVPEMDVNLYEMTKKAALESAEEHARAAAGELEGVSAQVEVMTTYGHITDEILEIAAQKNADLVVLGSRGLGTFTGWLLGSVSHAVVGAAPCSVCVARLPVDGKFHDPLRVTIAIDGSADAEAAAVMLANLHLGEAADISVLHVVPDAPALHAQVESEFASRVEEKYRQDAQELVDSVAASLRRKYRLTTTMVRDGDPANEIIAWAGEWKSDLIVMGTRGLSGLARLLVGSVATKVATYAPCSVMVVKHVHPATP